MATIEAPPTTPVLAGLRALDELLDSPELWTKGSFACDESHYGCHPLSPGAVAWCLRGAAMRVTCNGMAEGHLPLVDALAGQVAAPHYCLKPASTSVVQVFNDHPWTKFEDVKALIARAIEAEEARL